MNVGNFKGALLEYIIRQLLKNCGFTNVTADNLYTYESSGLFFVNGKGAAHDADIIMNPPIQMPFSYPSQLIFECKAYAGKVSLPVVRNVLGFRNDINEFEIVTKKSIKKRQNNRRNSYAIENRNRFIFQIGVAAINDFSKPSIEFAANNKIPLISLSWFLGPGTIADINSIDQNLIDSYGENTCKSLYNFFKDRTGNLRDERHQDASNFLNADNLIGDIVTFANTAINYSYVGILETGDMIFLFARSRSEDNILNQRAGINAFKATIHWNSNRPNVWRLSVINGDGDENQTDFDFYVPKRIYDHWRKFNLDKQEALNIKERFFSKIFVFNRAQNPVMPFSIISIDQEWLQNLRE